MDNKENNTQGEKETNGKTEYELDRERLEAVAKRMQQNKGKYEPYNRKKPMDLEKLKQGLMRHTVEVMKGNYADDGVELGHILALACNSMFLYNQLSS